MGAREGGTNKARANQLEGVLFDLDGVLYNGDEPIPGAAETLAWIRGRDIPHLFLTNTTSRPRSTLVAKLERFGIVADEPQILTPAAVAADWIRQREEGPVALFAPAALGAEFAGLPLLDETAEQGASYVVIGDSTVLSACCTTILRRASSHSG